MSTCCLSINDFEWWKSYISNSDWTWCRRLKWHIQPREQLEWRLGCLLLLKFVILSLFHSIPSHHKCSLIIFQTATSLCMCFGQGLHTQSRVCLNLGQTRFTLLAVIMTQTVREGDIVTLHPLTLSPSHSTWLMTKVTSPRAVPHRSLLPFVGVWAASLRLPCPFCSHRESRRGWPMGGEYDNNLQRKWAQCSGM